MKRRGGVKKESRSGKMSLLMLGLAGLGLGVWLFRSRRRKASGQR